MAADYVEYVSARLPHLRRVAHALVADPHRADDLVQETITKLYLHWNRAGRAGNLDAYTQTVLVRTFLDEHRRPWARVGLTSSPPQPVVAGLGLGLARDSALGWAWLGAGRQPRSERDTGFVELSYTIAVSRSDLVSTIRTNPMKIATNCRQAAGFRP